MSGYFKLVTLYLHWQSYLEFFRSYAVQWVPDFLHSQHDQESSSHPPQDVWPSLAPHPTLSSSCLMCPLLLLASWGSIGGSLSLWQPGYRDGSSESLRLLPHTAVSRSSIPAEPQRGLCRCAVPAHLHSPRASAVSGQWSRWASLWPSARVGRPFSPVSARRL